jgi:hypothetical protein
LCLKICFADYNNFFVDSYNLQNRFLNTTTQILNTTRPMTVTPTMLMLLLTTTLLTYSMETWSENDVNALYDKYEGKICQVIIQKIVQKAKENFNTEGELLEQNQIIGGVKRKIEKMHDNIIELATVYVKEELFSEVFKQKYEPSSLTHVEDMSKSIPAALKGGSLDFLPDLCENRKAYFESVKHYKSMMNEETLRLIANLEAHFVFYGRKYADKIAPLKNGIQNRMQGFLSSERGFTYHDNELTFNPELHVALNGQWSNRELFLEELKTLFIHTNEHVKEIGYFEFVRTRFPRVRSDYLELGQVEYQ